MRKLLIYTMAVLKAARLMRQKYRESLHRESYVPKAPEPLVITSLEETAPVVHRAVEVVEPLEAPQAPVAPAEPPESEPTEAVVISFAAAKERILAKRYLSQGVLE